MIKTLKRLALTTGFGMAIALAAPSFADEYTSPVYLLANLHVQDFDTYMNGYANPLGPLLMDAGAEVLVATPDATKVEGDNQANLTVVIRFPSADAANAFYTSPAYQELRINRVASTDAALSTLVVAPEFTFPAH